MERNGGLFPLLILRNGKPSATAALWARALDREGWSDSKIEGHLRALAAFYSYSMAVNEGGLDGSDDPHATVCSFADARFRGTVQQSGEDPTGLYWSRILVSSVAEEIRAINSYSDFVSNYLNLPPINPEESKLLVTARYYSNARELGRSDAMIHLKGIRRKKNARKFELSKRRGAQSIARQKPKYLRPEEAIELVEVGCVNPRDKMLVLLMAFAGLRISEPLHLYLGDVTQTFSSRTRATKVRLEHPVTGVVTDCSNSTGGLNRRHDYLLRTFGRLPRNELGRGHRDYSGWKGMLLTEADPESRYAFWLEEGIVGGFFRTLFEQYVEDHRRAILSQKLRHPYLFFNIGRTRSGAEYGQPMSLSNAREVFASAAKRARISCSPHACRHHYGFYAADVLGLSQETLMRMLHHSVITSTDVYYNLDVQSIRGRIAGLEFSSSYSRPSYPSHWGAR